MSTRLVPAALVAVVFAGCVQSGADRLASPTATPSTGRASPSPSTSSPDPSPQELRPFACDRPAPSPGTPGPAEALPAALGEVAGNVVDLRGLDFERDPVVEAVSSEEMSRRVREEYEGVYSSEIWEPREAAWKTIGVIPADADLDTALLDLTAGQVLGYYDHVSEQLVYIGSEDPSALQRTVLAHELTHALDDQHFDLGRLDELDSMCRDEEVEAFLSLAEGSARRVEVQWALTHLSPGEVAELIDEASSFDPPGDEVPAFLQDLLVAPYDNGQLFVLDLLDRGGQEELDAAFRDPPVTTEQILHPQRYPDDRPRQVELPSFHEGVFDDWVAIDELDVGESWLQSMLSLEHPDAQAADAAAGWDGGRYRAWSDGQGTIVVLATVWDNDAEAGEFADSVELWAEGEPSAMTRNGDRVTVVFASDGETLDRFLALDLL